MTRSVCLINDSFPPLIDGVANAVVNYAQILQECYGPTCVATPYMPNADDSQYPFEVVRYPSLDVTKWVGYRAGMPLSNRTLDILEKKQFDLIHCHCPVTAAVLARVLRDRLHVPLVFTYHTKFDVDIEKSVPGRLLQEESKRLLVANISTCDEVWTVSRGAGENLHALGYEGDYTVMPNGVSFPRGRVPEDIITRTTCGYDLPRNVPVFLFVGRIMWYKGIRVILDGLRQLMEEKIPFRMAFVGDGTDREQIMAYSRSLGLESCVFFVPAERDRTALRAWYCRADLFLFPSLFDTNGLVVREAAACGLASVLVRDSCAAEDVTDSVNGFLIEDGADALAELLKKLLQNRQILPQVGANAQNQLYLSWQDSVHMAMERYDIILENYRRGFYPEHQKAGDELFHAMASVMGSVNQAQDRFFRQYAQLHQRMDEDLQTVQSRWEEFMDRFM